ncbi:MAG TPA: T9SS type A sorting domain-containing protein [Candidatus Cloacimonetes bacterium]|nr:T9SS type A sorting domain-containing protein [Candidatus Cloacimonadota bacterium]HEX37580.1 T9SS type A sorting domain-containing protein [Candidatus Cloacimonadota bacterium]
MKKFLMIVGVLFLFAGLSASTIEQVYHFDNPVVRRVDADYHTIEFSSTMQSANIGQPVLPYRAVSLLLPPGEEAISIEIIAEDKISLTETYVLYPRQYTRPISKGESGIFAINHKLYNDSTTYPKSLHGELTTHYMNGYGFAFSSVTPVQYIPKTGEVSYFRTVRVIVTTEEISNKQENLLSVISSSDITQKVLHIADNPDMIEFYSPSARNDDYNILIITPQDYIDEFDDLIAMYLTQGLLTEVAAVEDIDLIMNGSDVQEKIRNYIIQEYQNAGIEYVILGGDNEYIPHRGFYCQVQSSSVYTDDDIPADLYYSALDGTWNDDGDSYWGEIGEDDLLPDVSVGRISFSNSAELANVLNKSMMYQESPILGELEDPILAGEDLYDNPQTWGGDYLDLLVGYHEDNGYTTDGIPPSQNIETLYDRDIGYWDSSQLINKINEGKSYIHHSGHASETYCMRMYSSSITNSNFSDVNGIIHNYTHVYTHGCLSGAFDDNDCIAEKMVNLENFAASFVGNSRYGWFNEGQTEGPSAHLHREYVNALYMLRTDRIGEAHLDSKIYTAPWVNAPGQHEEGALRWCFYCCNVIGDPVMSIWTGEPIAYQVTHPDSIYIGQNQLQVAVSGMGNSTEGLVCTLLKDGVFHGKAVVNSSGIASIPIDPVFTEVGTIQLFITGYQALKSEYDITIIPSAGAYVIIDTFATKDDNNNIPEYTEEVTFDFTLENVGTQDATNVIATLSTNDDYITCSYSTAFFGTILAGGTATQEDVLPIIVDAYVPDQHISTINMNISADDEQTWDMQLSITLNAPVLEMGEVIIDDSSGDNDGILDPGETVTMTIPTMNTGHATSPEATAVLSCTNNLITIQSSSVNLGLIEAGVTENAEYIVSADPQLNEGTSVTFQFDVNAGSYSIYESFDMCVGLMIEDFESGDFFTYDWYFGGNADWTIDELHSFEGTYCAKTGTIDNQSETSLKIDIEVFTDGEISFWKKVSTENNYDFLQFYIDGSMQDEWSGEIDWSQETYLISAGVHTLEWRYDKDWSVTGGLDCAWIDYIIFPPLGAQVSNDEISEIQQNFLESNFPNPFSTSTSISFMLKEPAKVEISIYNILGQKVKTLINDEKQTGFYSLEWDGNDASGIPVANGVYFYRMATNGFQQSKKMILIK